jgi:hypothetical protein
MGMIESSCVIYHSMLQSAHNPIKGTIMTITIEYYPSKEVAEFGQAVASALFDADVRKAMDGLGGCKEFNYDDFDKELHPFIEAYLLGNNDSVAIMYAAMRWKESQK